MAARMKGIRKKKGHPTRRAMYSQFSEGDSANSNKRKAGRLDMLPIKEKTVLELRADEETAAYRDGSLRRFCKSNRSVNMVSEPSGLRGHFSAGRSQ